MTTDTLNPVFFDNENVMIEDVRQNLMQVARDILTELDDMEFDVSIFVGLILTGSMLTSSWDEHSDLDLHILYNLGPNPEEDPQATSIQRFLVYFAKVFNQEEYMINGKVVEIYFQDIYSEHYALSMYDLVGNDWVTPPNTDDIQFTDEIKQLARPYEELVDDFISTYKNSGVDPFTLLQHAESLRNQMVSMRSLADRSSKESFVKSKENLVFKWLRRNGYFQKMSDAIHDITELTYNVKH